MITKKIWILNKPDATQSDSIFLFGLGCEVEVIIPEWQDFETSNGTRCRYLNENPYIEITTTCKKQEMMLQLKYGDELKIKSVVHTKLMPYKEIHEQRIS